jgi:hypothetical protein
LTPVYDPQIHEKLADINTLYRLAPALTEQGERIMSTDELSGVQALQRKHPTLPLRPGDVERQEFEYKGHGTQCFIINFEVATGKVVAPSYGYTQTEEDFLNHIKQTVKNDPLATRWHFVVDDLNTHQSESLVRCVADESDIVTIWVSRAAVASSLLWKHWSPKYWPSLTTTMTRWRNPSKGRTRAKLLWRNRTSIYGRMH